MSDQTKPDDAFVPMTREEKKGAILTSITDLANTPAAPEQMHTDLGDILVRTDALRAEIRRLHPEIKTDIVSHDLGIIAGTEESPYAVLDGRKEFDTARIGSENHVEMGVVSEKPAGGTSEEGVFTSSEQKMPGNPLGGEQTTTRPAGNEEALVETNEIPETAGNKEDREASEAKFEDKHESPKTVQSEGVKEVVEPVREKGGDDANEKTVAANTGSAKEAPAMASNTPPYDTPGRGDAGDLGAARKEGVSGRDRHEAVKTEASKTDTKTTRR